MLPFIRNLTIHALEGTPTVLTSLLASVPHDSDVWDYRPYAERFTIREILAHLAELDGVVQERIQRTRQEEEPFLPNWDEERAALENDYASIAPHQSLELFSRHRAATVAQLRECSDDDWQRKARRENIGLISLAEQVQFVLAHDGYHTRQVAEWLAKAEQDGLL